MRRLHLTFFALALLLPACAPDRSLAPVGPPARAREVRVCAAVDGELREFSGWIEPGTGDTLVAGRPLREVIPNYVYAAGQRWFERDEPITVGNRRVTKYGMLRSLSSADLRDPGLRLSVTYQGVDVFEFRDRVPGDVYYVPVSPGCIFQPYGIQATIGDRHPGRP
ncbi:MAG TPA: hypothetical protein VF746_31925 [Longimicrobium sp.]|jgi:hypothetical protein